MNESKFFDTVVPGAIIGWYCTLFAAEINGLYIAYNESFASLLVSLFIPPLAIFRGFLSGAASIFSLLT